MIKKYILALLLATPLPVVAIEMVAGQPAPRPVTARSILPICGANDYVTVEPSGTRLICKRLPAAGIVSTGGVFGGQPSTEMINFGNDWAAILIETTYVHSGKGGGNSATMNIVWNNGSPKAYTYNAGTFTKTVKNIAQGVNTCYLANSNFCFTLNNGNLILSNGTNNGQSSYGGYVKFGPR